MESDRCHRGRHLPAVYNACDQEKRWAERHPVDCWRGTKAFGIPSPGTARMRRRRLAASMPENVRYLLSAVVRVGSGAYTAGYSVVVTYRCRTVGWDYTSVQGSVQDRRCRSVP